MTRTILLTVITLAFTCGTATTAWAWEASRLPSDPEPQATRLLQRREQRREHRLSRQERESTAVASSRTRVSVRRETARVMVRRTATDRRKQVTAVHAAASVHPLQEEMLRLVNGERAAVGLTALTLHPQLQASAQRYAEWMAQDRFFSHTDPDGGSSVDRIRETGYLHPPCDCAYRYVTGENLAHNQAIPAAAMDAWMDSPPHRANILHPQFEEMGVGYADGYWVQHFGGMMERS